MSISDKRMVGIYEALTAKERALMRVRWNKEDVEEPASLHWTTPPRQIAEVNHLTDLFKETSTAIAWLAFWLQSRLASLSAGLGTVALLRSWGIRNERLRELLVFGSGEPVTQSEYEQRLAEARAELVPISDWAELLVERELEAEDLIDREYERRRRGHERRLRGLVEEGQLPSTRKGRTLCVSTGDFYAWLGEAAPVFPEMGAFLEVLPDEAAEAVVRMRGQRAAMMEGLLAGPISTGVPDADGLPAEKRPLGPRMADEIAASLSEIWSELVALDRVIAEVAEDLDGEEPIYAETRQVLDEAKATAVELAGELGRFVEGFELPAVENDTFVEALMHSLWLASAGVGRRSGLW